jgi:hypothetical protein
VGAYGELQSLNALEAPYTVLYDPHQLTAARRRLRGVEPDPRGPLAGAARWWIGPAADAAPPGSP